MLQTRPIDNRKAKDRPCIGLALAGGGPLGVIYEIGAIHALEEALEGVAFNHLDVYVGVSAGAAVASALANRFSTAKITRIFIRTESRVFPLDPEHFLRPAFDQYIKGLSKIPGLSKDAFIKFITNPQDWSLVGALSVLSRAVPTGFLNNDHIDHFLGKLYSSRGRSNDFRKLKCRLFVIATNLDSGEAVKFGSPGNNHIPISKAVQASTALPGVYPPVEIEGRYYVDGALRKTLHASTALNAGADLLFCINPIVPFNANLTKTSPLDKKFETLYEGGLPVVMSQAFHALIHSRMAMGMSKYKTLYPNKDVILFEPNTGDAKIFYTNVFSFANRLRVCEHAYQTTRQDLLARRDDLETLFARYGITLRTDILENKSLHFDSNLHIPELVTRQARLQNPITNQLSDTLDELQEWLELHWEELHRAPQ
jgi:NTE family protein